jgi:tRNA U34 5-methylaminomethyl-2-thiouridine-forming methyltransferase MnmC
MTLTNDGSYTLYSPQFSQHYHSVKAGAVNESLSKHVIPALNWAKENNLKQINILDICFGLGYNTFSTIDYILQNNIDIKVNFHSPEFDGDLVKSLKSFNYPKEFEYIKHIIDEVSQNNFYEDDRFKISLFIGNARKYIKEINNIDVVYQDAFSSDVNKELWTKEYFEDIYRCTKDKCLMTTYSIATPIRLGMWESGFEIFEYRSGNTDRQTVAFKCQDDAKLSNIKYIDMVLKQQRNTTAVSLKD